MPWRFPEKVMMLGTPFLAAIRRCAVCIDLLQAIVILVAIERVGNRAAGAGRIHGGEQAVFLERGPVGGADEIVAFAAETRGFAAGIFERRGSARTRLG